MRVELGGLRIEVKGLAGWVTVAGLILMAAAVLDQLQRAPSARTWEGRLWGAVPYDFRAPTIGRILGRYWDPASERVLVEKAFGVGWDVNLAAAGRKLKLWD